MSETLVADAAERTENDWEEAMQSLRDEYELRIVALDEFLKAEAQFATVDGNIVIPVAQWDAWMDRLADIGSSPYAEVFDRLTRIYEVQMSQKFTNAAIRKFFYSVEDMICAIPGNRLHNLRNRIAKRRSHGNKELLEK